MTTIDAELEICPAYGWQGGPEFNTLIKQLRSGRERRRPLWDYAKHRYTLPFQNITNAAYLLELKSLFMAARGQAESFLVRDSSDYLANDAVFGFGNGTEDEFDLLIGYTFGSAQYARKIMHPVNPVFYVNGTPATATFSEGIVTFDSPPSSLAELSWSGEYRVPVRFASDAMPMSIDNISGNNFIMNGSIELIEVWE